MAEKEYSNSTPISTVSLGKAKKVVHAMDTMNFDNNCEISFEYLVGSLFPDIFNQVEERIHLAYTQGYIDGMSERLEDSNDYIS